MPYPSWLPTFQNLELLEQALTHKSYIRERLGSGRDNERLEFLGDAVLNFASAAFLYTRYPEQSEGELTPLRSALVDATQLAEFARALSLAQRLRRGKSLTEPSDRVLSSAFEALIGAYYIDSGINAAQDYLNPWFAEAMFNLANRDRRNCKKALQEWAQKRQLPLPEYAVISASGPDHAREFVVTVALNGTVIGQGRGRRKQDAEQAAAGAALANLPPLPLSLFPKRSLIPDMKPDMKMDDLQRDLS